MNHSLIIVRSCNYCFLSIPNNSKEYELKYGITTSTSKAGLKSTIARFDPFEKKLDKEWKKLGDLNVAREGHGVIQVDNEFIVVGGTSIKVTESCKLNGESITCTTRTPTLWSFQFYPELILLP